MQYCTRALLILVLIRLEIKSANGKKLVKSSSKGEVWSPWVYKIFRIGFDFRREHSIWDALKIRDFCILIGAVGTELDAVEHMMGFVTLKRILWIVMVQKRQMLVFNKGIRQCVSESKYSKSTLGISSRFI